MKKAKKDWIGAQCEEFETCLIRTNNKGVYQMAKDLTSEKQVDPQLSRIGLGNALQKNKRFSADGQTIAQNCTTMRVVVSAQLWTAVNPRKKICKRCSLKKLKLK